MLLNDFGKGRALQKEKCSTELKSYTDKKPRSFNEKEHHLGNRISSRSIEECFLVPLLFVSLSASYGI